MGTIQAIRQNLMPNTKAALTTAPWGLFTTVSGSTPTGTLTRNTSVGRSGTTSFQITTTVSTFFRFDQFFSHNPNNIVRSNFYVKTASGTGTVQNNPAFYDSAGTFVTQSSGAATNVNSSTWTQIQNGFNVSAFPTVAQVKPALLLYAGFTYYVTDILHEYISTLVPFFDGDSVDTYGSYATLSKGWYGTPNASSSFAEFGLASAQNLGSVLDGPDVLGF